MKWLHSSTTMLSRQGRSRLKSTLFFSRSQTGPYMILFLQWIITSEQPVFLWYTCSRLLKISEHHYLQHTGRQGNPHHLVSWYCILFMLLQYVLLYHHTVSTAVSGALQNVLPGLGGRVGLHSSHLRGMLQEGLFFKPVST